MNGNRRISRSAFLIGFREIATVFAIIAFPMALVAQPTVVEPLVTKAKIEAAAAKCQATVTISEIPTYGEETDSVPEGSSIIVGIKRDNSPESIACMQASVQTVVTMLTGRAKGVPALTQESLDDLLKTCDWRKEDGSVLLLADEELQFQPAQTADYDRVECVFAGIRPYAMKLGFVGNEQYRSSEEPAKGPTTDKRP